MAQVECRAQSNAMEEVIRMNTKQRAVLILGIVLFTLSELFPPWLYVATQFSAQRSAGYHYRFSAPVVKSPAEMRQLFPFPEDNPTQYKVRLDYLRLYIQRFIITSLAIGLLLVWRERRPKLIFAAGGLFLCVGIAFIALFFWIGPRP
jgi:hypothetical protein